MKQPYEKALEWLRKRDENTQFEIAGSVEGIDEIEKSLKLCQKETIKRVFEEIGRIQARNYPNVGIFSGDLIRLRKKLLEELK